MLLQPVKRLPQPFFQRPPIQNQLCPWILSLGQLDYLVWSLTLIFLAQENSF